MRSLEHMHRSRFQLLHTTLFLRLIILLAMDLFYPHSQTCVLFMFEAAYTANLQTAARGGVDLIYDECIT